MASAYFVAIPKKPLTHIQKMAPGPPRQIAPATPARFPVPTVAAKAVHRQRNEVSVPSRRSKLEQIEGIGSKSIQTLLRHFRTVEKVRTAPLEEVAGIVGQAKARKIKQHFDNKTNT